MSLSRKISKWIENQIITAAQGSQILEYEKSHNNVKFWKTAYTIAGLLIGLGICLMVSANWAILPTPVKLIGDFALLGCFIYGVIWAKENQKNFLREFFLLLSFLMIGATIGLIGQIFNLDGGWSSFAIFWSILGLPFVLLSQSLFFNFCWLCLFFTLFDFDWLDTLFRYIDKHIEGVVFSVLLLSLLSYAGKKLDKAIHSITILPRAFSILSMFMAYVVIFILGFLRRSWFFLYMSGISPFVIHAFSFLFFGARMFLAVRNQNVISFRRNALALEIYIFLLFSTRFGNLLMSGFGFVVGGLLILLMIYALKKTSKYIQSMEIFK